MGSNELAFAGRVWLRDCLTKKELQEIGRHADSVSGAGQRVRPATPLFQTIAKSTVSTEITKRWPGMKAVRVVAFEKHANVNWAVPWHQDRIVAVANRVEMAGFSNWSNKNGDWHCEPPLAVLQQMLFVRIHLDKNTAQNGAMEIACGSHAAGPVTAGEAEATAERNPCEITAAEAGDVLVLPMLTLHRSIPSQSAASRRVIRVDYAAIDLPTPLLWSSASLQD